ncbi:hypothetical protein Gohar_018628, partial [Gossypium harknessii]|nr:hypothetical protein [Gossypium harknessii]
LLSKYSKAWTKAFQGLHSVSGIIDNNLYEAFNSSIVDSWKYNYGPLMKKKFDDTKKEGVDWKRKSGIEPVLPPIEKKMPGRPKKNKRKAKNEPKKVNYGQLNRAGLIMRCRKCGGEGHNRKSCFQANTTGS